MYKDKDNCKSCGKELVGVPGKVQPTFCSDKCRKALTRAELKKLEPPGCPPVDKPRTDGTKQPRTSTADKPISDNLGQGMTKYTGPTLCNPNLTKRLPKRGCKYCGKELEYAVLECCYDCALKQPTKVSPAKDGHILASRPALEFTGELTDYEREHYKPASDLKPGQYNPVSKPGDAHYSLSRTSSTKGAGL